MASLYKRGSIYYIAIHQDGRRIYKSTGEKRKPEGLKIPCRAQEKPRKAQARYDGGISEGLPNFLQEQPRTKDLSPLRPLFQAIHFIHRRQIHSPSKALRCGTVEEPPS